MERLVAVAAVVAAVMAAVMAALAPPAAAHLGSCEDHTPECRRYAANGLCRTQRHFMLLNCPVSCDVCLDPECYDRSARCGELAGRGRCRTQPQFMLSTCPHSCDACRLGPTSLSQPLPRRQTIDDPTLECGRGVQPRVRGRSLAVPGGARSRGARQVVFPDEPHYDKTIIAVRTRNPSIAPLDKPDEAPTRIAPPNPDPPGGGNPNEIDVRDTFCGATPISDQYLLTAAHCVFDTERPVRTVRLGELDFASDNEENSRPVDHEVAEIIVHPDYKYDTLERYNDVAILKTVEKIAFNDVVFPYCISGDRPAPKTLVTGAGFGFVNATHRPTRLQEAELEIVAGAQCEAIYRREGRENSLKLKYPQLLQGRDILCASYPERDACGGDSGGPLFLDRDGKRYLIGIVGSGVSCRSNSASVLPGLYISVADHIDFIDSVLYGNQ